MPAEAAKKNGRPKKANPAKKSGRPKSAPEETREKLLKAATTLFAEKGMAATSLSRVADAAGVTSAMVHYYFNTKERLIDAVVVERLSKFMAQVLGDKEFNTDEPLEYALNLVPRLAEAVNANPWMPGLWVREVISENGGLRDHVFKLLPKDLLGRLTESFRRGVEAGQYSAEVEPSLLLFTVITNYMLPLAASGFLERLPGMGELTPERLTRHARAVLRHGFSAPAASPRPGRSEGDS